MHSLLRTVGLGLSGRVEIRSTFDPSTMWNNGHRKVQHSVEEEGSVLVSGTVDIAYIVGIVGGKFEP